MYKILFTGDVFLNNSKKINIGRLLTERIKVCNAFCMNFEGAISDSNHFVSKIGPSIKQNTSKIEDFINDKCFSETKIVLDMANNHIMDCEGGLEYSIKEFSSYEIVGAGNYIDAYKPVLIDEKKEIAILALAEYVNGSLVNSDISKSGIAWFGNACVDMRIGELSKQFKHVIIVCHAGLEDVDVPLPEIRELYKHFIDLGADCVIAHHPHVVQGMETYHGKNIFYSLGNFMFDSLDNPDKPYNGNGICVELTIDENQVDYEIIPVFYDGENIEIHDNQNLFIDATSKLMSKDYESIISDACVKLYKENIRAYLKNSWGSAGVKYNLVRALKSLFGINEFDDRWIEHCILNETNGWVIKRALMEMRED